MNKFDHISDPRLADSLEAYEATGDPEARDHVIKSAIAALRDDELDEDLEPRELDRRRALVRIVESSWGDGEDGDAKAGRAAFKFWVP